MKRLLAAGAALGTLLVLVAVPLTSADRPGMFDPAARLDSTQVNDSRNIHAETVCVGPDDKPDCVTVYWPERRF